MTPTFKVDDLVMHEDYKYPVTIANVLGDDYYEIRCSNVYGGITFRMVHVNTLSEVEKTVEGKLQIALDRIKELEMALFNETSARSMWQAEALRLRATTDDIPF